MTRPFKCPFEDCEKAFGSKKTLKRHVRDQVRSTYDQVHSQDSPHFNDFLPRRRKTREEKAQEKREREKRRYEANKRIRFPLQSEVNDFKVDWNKEAGYMKTPHHEKGSYILKQLGKIPYEIMDKFSIRDHPLHEDPPTVERLVADVHYADEKNELQLIDSRSSKPDGISEHSAKNLMNCIESVANKSFDSASRSVHYAMVEVAPSPNGLKACRPTIPPLNLLTKSGSEPIYEKERRNKRGYSGLTRRASPLYRSLLTAGGMYTALHYDYTFLACLALVIAKDRGRKLFLFWPPNDNNLRYMSRRAQGETSLGWEDHFGELTGLKVAILSHGEYVIMPEGTLHCVLTVGTAGVTGFGYARDECLTIPRVGEWDVQRLEWFEMDGINPDIGREALLSDAENLLHELDLLVKLPTFRKRGSQSKIWFDELRKRLNNIKRRLGGF